MSCLVSFPLHQSFINRFVFLFSYLESIRWNLNKFVFTEILFVFILLEFQSKKAFLLRFAEKFSNILSIQKMQLFVQPSLLSNCWTHWPYNLNKQLAENICLHTYYTWVWALVELVAYSLSGKILRNSNSFVTKIESIII